MAWQLWPAPPPDYQADDGKSMALFLVDMACKIIYSPVRTKGLHPGQKHEGAGHRAGGHPGAQEATIRGEERVRKGCPI